MEFVRDIAQLEAIYAPAQERSVRKQMDRLDEQRRAFMGASPMLMLATMGALPDNSPRGDVPGFVKVADDTTLLSPDRGGNNRIDSLRNIVVNPRVGLLFLVPGVHETFRVNGEAFLSKDPGLLRQFEMKGALPRTVIVVKVREAYIHCARALVRADLWNPAKFAPPGTVPSFGTIMAAHTQGFVDAAKLDEENVTRVPVTLY